MRILVADDHTLVREGICKLVNSQPDMQVIAEAENGEEAWLQGRLLAPDVIVMDISMPKLTGAQATERLRASCPQTRILAVSAYGDAEHVRQLLSVGASGYVLKKSASADLIKAIRTVAGGDVYLDPDILCQELKKEGIPTPQHEATPLSPREIEVLIMIAYGHTNQAIADNLCLSIKTVEAHKARIGQKLKLSTRAEIVNYAIKRGWLNSAN